MSVMSQDVKVVAPAATTREALRLFAERRRSFWVVLSLLVLFTAWEIAGRVPISFAFPTFLDTLAAFFEMVADGSMIRAFFLTLQPLVLGVAISALLGIALGIVMGLSDRLEWLLAPVFIVLQAAPMAALVPLVTFVYGIGLVAKTLAVIMLALPVIVLNSYKAVRHVNPSLVDMCRSFRRVACSFRGLAPGRGCRLHRRHAGRTADHPHGDRRPDHLSPLGRQLRAHVCGRRRHHRGVHRDAGPAAVVRDQRHAPRKEEELR